MVRFGRRCVCVCVAGGGWIQSRRGIKVGRPSEAQHQRRDQTRLSHSNHPRGHSWRTRVRPPAGSKSVYTYLRIQPSHTQTSTHTHIHLQDGDLGFHAVFLLAGLFLEYFNGYFQSMINRLRNNV